MAYGNSDSGEVIVACQNGINGYENYWHNFQRTDAVHVMSVAKSVAALLIGIAIDKGLMENVNVLEFFPDYKVRRGEKTYKKQR